MSILPRMVSAVSFRCVRAIFVGLASSSACLSAVNCYACPPGLTYVGTFHDETDSDASGTDVSVDAYLGLQITTQSNIDKTIDRSYRMPISDFRIGGGGATSLLKITDIPNGFWLGGHGSESGQQRWSIDLPKGGAWGANGFPYSLHVYADNGNCGIHTDCAGATVVADLCYKAKS